MLKNEDFGFEIFEKAQILRLFSGLAPSKLKICLKMLIVAYVHIEYLPIFSSQGGHMISPILLLLRYVVDLVKVAQIRNFFYIQ